MMMGEATSLSVLAAIANEHRNALKLQGAMKHRNALKLQGATKQTDVTPQVVTPKTPTKVAVAAPTKPKQTPKEYLKELFASQNITASHVPKRFSRDDFTKPDDEECKEYNAAARLVRTNDIEKLRAMHEEGKNLDVCNRVGESLLHLSCRRGHVEMTDFLLSEAKVRWDLQDDFGRTVLHDACWRPSPCTDLMEVLLKVVSPEWLMAQDVRGHTPFDYARREHSEAWYDFLKRREDTLKYRLSLLC